MRKEFSYSWILMWSLAYISCAFIKPDLVYGVPKHVTTLTFFVLGITMLVALLMNEKKLLFVCGIGEVFAGVISWVGVVRWNVPLISGYDPLVQISMSLLDLISAVFIFYHSFEIIEKLYIKQRKDIVLH